MDANGGKLYFTRHRSQKMALGCHVDFREEIWVEHLLVVLRVQRVVFIALQASCRCSGSIMSIHWSIASFCSVCMLDDVIHPCGLEGGPLQEVC